MSKAQVKVKCFQSHANDADQIINTFYNYERVHKSTDTIFLLMQSVV